jgi:alanine racemase
VIRGAVAEVNLSAIKNNFQYIKDLVKKRPIIAVVKADAYGHGAIEVSKTLIQAGASYLAVAYTSEAIELRDAGINAPIIVLFDREDVKEFFDFKLIPVIYSLKTAMSFSKEAKKRNTSIKVHVKVDTGMGRLGLSGKNVVDDIISISKMDGLKLSGILSHFSEADLSDRSYAIMQLKKFNEIRNNICDVLKRKIFSHIANSAAILTFQDANLDAVRPGLMLYGYSHLNHRPEKKQEEHKSKSKRLDIIPAMKIKTKILCIRNVQSGSPISYGRTFITKRTSKIGVIPIGYADGYNRLFSNNADVIVKKTRVPVVGRVCMDLTMIDLTDLKRVSENEEVIIMGTQGKESITAYELARRIDTIPYEILTTFGTRSKRIYVEAH